MMRIVCFGDSITEGSDFRETERWTARLQELLDDKEPGAFEVLNRGKDGQTTEDALARISKDVVTKLPAIVLVEFGFNDANVRDFVKTPRVSLDDYSKNLFEICRIVRDRGGTPVVVINHMPVRSDGIQGNGKTYEQNFAPYNPAALAVAKQLNVPSINLPVLMKDFTVKPEEFLDSDGLHLSLEGNETYARMIFAGLRPVIGKA